MNLETGITLYEKIKVETNGNLLPIDLGKIVSSLQGLYDIYLFLFIVQRAEDRSTDLIWDKKFIAARNAIYPEYEDNPELEEFLAVADNILYSFNEAREIEHYNDILDKIPVKLKLRITKITTNSPVKIELLGLGEVIREFKEFILSLVNLGLSRSLTRQELRKKELENFEKILQMSVEYRLSPEMIAKSSAEFASLSKNMDRMLNENKIRNLQIEEEN